MEFNRVEHPKLLNLFPENPSLKHEIHTQQSSTQFFPTRAGLPVGSNLDRSNLVDHIDDFIAPSDPSFHQFDNERSYEKFKTGQIWAFYSDEDELPKYYGKIKDFRRIGSTIELKVIFVTDYFLPKKVVRWDDEDMIISCGKFKFKPNGKICIYHNTNSISHQVDASIIGGIKNYEIYDIYPRKGEIWALYRGWTTKLKRSDLKNCMYDIVEVTEEGYSWTHILFLETVSGYRSVYKRKLTTKLYISIDRSEVLRFSHRIPAFKLTKEHDSNLKGFWELDPDAIPVHYLSKE
jgi:hypothetical protein